MELLELIQNNNIKTLSLVGMGKNVGKTTLLNYLIEEAGIKGIVLGVTSIGRDWEKKDILTDLEKPRLKVPIGTFLITTESSLKESRIKKEIIKKTKFNTPLGNLVVVKVLSRDFVELTGPQTAGQLKSLISVLKDTEAELIIVDGAFDRMMALAPSVTDGTIFVTGAVIDPLMERVIGRTKWKIELLSLPGIVEKELKCIADKIGSHRKIAFVDKKGHYKTIEYMPNQACGEIVGKKICDETETLIIGTSLTSAFISGLIKTKIKDGIKIVIHDASKILTDELWWKRFKNWGADVFARMPIKVAAVAINPYSVMGWEFEEDEFIDYAGRALKPIPVIDIVSDMCRNMDK